MPSAHACTWRFVLELRPNLALILLFGGDQDFAGDVASGEPIDSDVEREGQQVYARDEVPATTRRQALKAQLKTEGITRASAPDNGLQLEFVHGAPPPTHTIKK